MNESTIFAAALERPTERERADFLAEACAGDVELLRRVEVLLRAHVQSDEILGAGRGGQAGTASFAPIAEKPGSKIGPYRLMEQIGEGGFGLVFVAEQLEPVRRKVALKLIKPGMDSRQVIARFEAERQALAMMDHPNIARVLEAGAADSGRPYFVMELVRGIPITEYCDQNQLTPAERMEIFVTVCNAIQHAHQKGIIHRDIKPSNVLVTSHDGKPVAKVIDFGVAKAIHQQLTERTIYTQFAQMIGTPLYMSPEQAEMSGLDIDTRSDIYSLGVLLYELLTGATPLEKNRVAKAAYDEIRRLIREDEPPRPSQRLSSSATLASVAASRKTEPARLSNLLKGELDWIVMKALEKDRTRRYETANGLAHDIQRYLADEVVEARPPTAGYRLRKFVRRHKGRVVAFGLLLLALVGGMVGTTAGLVQARKSASAEARERMRAEAATLEESKARTIAEKERDRARRLLGELGRRKEQQRRQLYTAQIKLAQDAWENGNYSRVRDLLNATRPAIGEPDLRGFEWNYWQRQLHDNEQKLLLPIEPGTIATTMFSHDGEVFAAVTTSPRVVRAWAADSGKELFRRELAGKSTPWLPHIAFLDAERIAIVEFAGSQRRLAMLNFDGEGETYSLSAYSKMGFGPQPFVFSSNGARVAGWRAESWVQVWDGLTGEAVEEVANPVPSGDSHDVRMVALSLSPDGTRLAIKPLVESTVAAPLGITIVDLGTKAAITTPSLEAAWLEFSPDGSRLAASHWSPSAPTTVFDTVSGKLVSTFLGRRLLRPAFTHSPLHFSQDGKWLTITSDADMGGKASQLWNVATGELGPRFTGYESAFLRVAFSSDGSHISAHEDGAIVTRRFPQAAAEPIDQSLGQPPAAASARLKSFRSRDGRWTITALQNVNAVPVGPASPDEAQTKPTELKIEDATGKGDNRILPLGGPLHSAFISPHGVYAVACCVIAAKGVSEQTLEFVIVELGKKKEPRSIRIPVRGLIAETDSRPPIDLLASYGGFVAAFSGDDRRFAFRLGSHPDLAIAAKDRTIHVWDLATGRELPLRMTAKERPLASGLTGLQLGERGELLFVVEEASRDVNQFAREPTMPRDRSTKGLEVWEVASGERLWNKPDVVCASSSADTRVLAGIIQKRGASLDQSFALGAWAARSGKTIGTIPLVGDHASARLFMNGDGSRVALVGERDATIYAPAKGKKLFSLQGHSESIRTVVFSADGKRIASSAGLSGVVYPYDAPRSMEGETKVWDAATGQELLSLDGAGNLRMELTAHRLGAMPRPLFDASPLSPESQAAHVIDWLSSTAGDQSHTPTRRELLARIEAEPSIDEPTRDAARRRVRNIARPAQTLNRSAWAIVESRGCRRADYERAIELAAEAQDTDSSAIAQCNIVAAAHYRLGQFAEALERLERSIEGVDLRSASPADLIFLAMTHYRLGHRHNALDAFRIADRMASMDATDIFASRTTPESLLSEAAALLRTQPAFRRVATAMVSFKDGQFDRTIRDCDAALEIDPQSATAYNLRGWCFEKKREFDRAISDHTEAIRFVTIESDSQLARYYANRGLAKRENMDLAPAIEDFNEAIRLNPTDYLGYVNRGHACWDNDDLAAAIDDYTKALEFAPNNVEVLGNRAGAQIASGQYEEALEDIQQAILFGPDDPTGYWRRAWLRATSPVEKHRDGKQAVEDAKRGMMLNREREFHGLTTLAAAYAEVGEFDKAVECEAEAVPLALGKQKVDCEARLELYRRGQPYRTAPNLRTL